MNKKKFVTSFSIIVSAVLLLANVAVYFIFRENVVFSLIVTIIAIITLLIVLYFIDLMQNENNKEIENKLDNSTKQALNIGKIGILVYSDEYQIKWMSEFFDKYHINYVGDKILNWLPQLQDLLLGEVDSTVLVINEDKFEINKIPNATVLVFKEITKEYDLNKKLNDNSCVLGLVSYDNYEETQISEDESTYINTYIKNPVLDYFKKMGCVYKTLKNNVLLLILNDSIYKKIYEDRFSILKQVRRVSSEANLDVTLSIAFAMGSDNLVELDDTLNSLLELAKTRGGDQVVCKEIGSDAIFFGGASEAREKLSKTKVRINTNTIKDLVNKASNVIILGHKDSDADCIGSAICMSNIVHSMNKQAYIVYNTDSIEPMIGDVVKKYSDILYNKHNFLPENEAMEFVNDDSLVIMLDHHMKTNSNGKNILNSAKQVIIIDHHRRSADLDTTPLMFYCEASASSTCEIVCEFLQYLSKKIIITEEEANIMYLGILIDTDRFRVRTGARTFDVAKQLRKYGANPSVCEQLSEEPYENIINRSNIIASGRNYSDDIIIAAVKNGEYSRTIISQACDMIIKAKEVEAGFVICNTGNNEVVVSARSNGRINVQVILEKMNGGGHMTAAGLQRKDTTVEKIELELLKVLNEYMTGESLNESNIIK